MRGPSRRAAVAAGLLLCALYAATAAPAPVPWDGPEFATAFATFGIPHPPGSPLLVAYGRVVVGGLGGWVGISLAAAMASGLAAAVAGALLAWLVVRRGMAAGAATVVAVGAGMGGTWWTSATEPEAYAVALALAVAILAAASEAGLAERDGQRDRAWRWRAVAAYGVGLAPAVHQMAWVVVPGALVLGWPPRGAWSVPRLVWCAGAALLGASAAAMLYVRAQHAPPSLMGDASTLRGAWDMLTRDAYEGPGWWARRIGFHWQALMPAQYLLEQYGMGWQRLAAWPVARLVVALGVAVPLVGLGGRWWWRRDRAMAWALLVLVVGGSLGVAWHLNLRLGPSLGWGLLPDATPREVRERDTFFLVPLAAWGGLVATGLMSVLRGRAALGLLVLAGWMGGAWAEFDRAATPRDVRYAAQLESALASIPARAVVVADTDWDAYGLWYAQTAEGRRRDLTVVILGLLHEHGYRRRLAETAPYLVPPVWRMRDDQRIPFLQTSSRVHGRPLVPGPWTSPSVLDVPAW